MGLLNKFRKKGEKKDYKQEVIDNLTCLLNTKSTFGAWQEGMGLKSYAYNKSNLSVVNGIIDDIVYNIKNFEKRMEVLGVQVVDNKSALSIRFEIDCKIGGSFHSFYLGFKNYPEPMVVEVENVSED